MEAGSQRHAPADLPPGKTRYTLYRRLGGPQGWSGRVRQISSSPGFDPRTVRPVASRYTNWAIPAQSQNSTYTIKCVRKVAVLLGYGRVQLKCDGTRWRTGGEVRKVAVQL